MLDFASLPAQNKIYYRDESVVIYCADNREILPLFPDKSFDLVLTDPPYLITATGGGLGKIRGYDKWLDGLTDGFNIDILKPFDNWMCFCGKEQLVDLLTLAKENGRWMLLSWNKPDPTPLMNGNYLPDTEYIIHCFNKLYGDYSCRSRFTVAIGGTKEYHPTQKPLHLISKLVKVGSDINQTILDPFLGSGTTAVAAKILGRKCVGIEISEKYCEIAKKRCSQSVMQLDIPKPDIKQGVLY